MNESTNATSITIRSITRRYYGVWWTYAFAGGFLFGIYPIFLRARGLNQFQANSVLATYLAVTFLTDVPTGAFADALGRRRSLIVGCAGRCVAFLLYFTAHRYFVFLIAEAIDGIGTTFCNGAIDAWGVDALDAAGFGEVKDRLFSRISQLSTVGFMMSSVIGAYVANVNIAWPWILGAAGYLLCAVIGGRLMRGEKPRDAHVEVRAFPALISGRVAEGLRRGFNHRTVLLLSAATAIQTAAWAPFWMEWPVFFNHSYGVGVWIIGWLWSLFAIARMIGAEAVARFRGDESRRPAILTALSLGAASMLFLAGAAGERANLAVVILLAMNLCTGAMTPLAQSWFNEQIGSGNRATLLSFNSTLGTMGGAIGVLLGGWIADAYGISLGWQVSGVISLGTAACYWALRSGAAEPEVIVGVAK
jgi:MFS family permease